MPDSDDEFYECSQKFPSKFYAVAVPLNSPRAGVYSSMADANTHLKKVKGSRLKIFGSIEDASEYCASPVTNVASTVLNEPQGESCPFPSVKIVDLLALRRYITSNDIAGIQNLVSQNPLYLLTGYDTPSLLQLRFRYNALHVAATSGQVEVVNFILSTLDSNEFWQRLYPQGSLEAADERRRRVIDLYLNSPDTGNFSRPLHLASKFGHVECVRALASHPLTIVDVRDDTGQTPMDVACSRLLFDSAISEEEVLEKKQAICRALDERYVVLVDRLSPEDAGSMATILEPVTIRQLHQLVAATGRLHCPGLNEFCPQLLHQMTFSLPSTPPPVASTFPAIPFSPQKQKHTDTVDYSRCSSSSCVLNLKLFGSFGILTDLRAVLGPLSLKEAKQAITSWRKPSKIFWLKIRRMDVEKGYERYGRRLSTQLNTRWTEYWSFLDDFVDLRSDYGLCMLNTYLSQFYQEKGLGEVHTMKNENGHRRQLFTDDSDKAKIMGVEIKKTPIKRPKPNEIVDAEVATSMATKVEDKWKTYREDSNPTNVLNDSLEDTTSSSSSSANSSLSNSIQNSPNCKDDFISKRLSPVMGLLNNFIVSTPLRWVLCDSYGSNNPVFSTPVKRKSMFSREENTSEQRLTPKRTTENPFHFSSPFAQQLLHSKPIVRRNTIGKIWPSLIIEGSSGFQGSLVSAEISARSALSDEEDTTTSAGANKNSLLNNTLTFSKYPFVRKWKNEVDRSIQHS